MAGTATAPAMTAAATGRLFTLHLIDASGDLFTQVVPVPVAATAATLAAISTAYQAASNASIWAATDTILREGDADPDNAVADFRASVKDGINLSFKNPATRVVTPYRLIAPIDLTMQGNQDIPLLSSDELTNLITALLAVLTSQNFSRAQYTERRERKNNPVIK